MLRPSVLLAISGNEGEKGHFLCFLCLLFKVSNYSLLLLASSRRFSNHTLFPFIHSPTVRWT
jgi:hypothetical protein